MPELFSARSRAKGGVCKLDEERVLFSLMGGSVEEICVTIVFIEIILHNCQAQQIALFSVSPADGLHNIFPQGK